LAKVLCDRTHNNNIVGAQKLPCGATRVGPDQVVTKMNMATELKKEHPFRWYFLSVGYGSAAEIYGLFCMNIECEMALTYRSKSNLINETDTIVSAITVAAKAKVLVRYYYANPDDATYQSKSNNMIFKGFRFPFMKPSERPSKIDGLEQAYSELNGPFISVPEVSMMMVLANTRYDAIIRDFFDFINETDLKNGIMPISNLIYTDEIVSVKNLLSLYRLKKQFKRFENQFDAWCTKRNLDYKGF